MKMTISTAAPSVASITPPRLHRKVLRVASKRLRSAAIASGTQPHYPLHGKGLRIHSHQQSVCENSNDSGLGFDLPLDYHQHTQIQQHPLAVTRRYAPATPTNSWPLHHNNNNNHHHHQVRLAHETSQQFDPSKRRKLMDIKMESEDANDNYSFQENLNGGYKEPTSLIRTAPQSVVPSLSRTGNQTAASVRAVPRCVQLTNRRSPTGPITLTTQLGNVSRSGKVQLQILCQPEQQHRARYQTEGSRGAVKDRTGNGFPIVKLIGYEKPATLQVFIGTDMGRVAPHMFYQACRVSGKNSTPCVEKKIEGTIVIEVDFDPAKEMMVTCDCVGILKERNVDVEHRFPDQSGPRSKKKSTRCRMVFRTTITHDDGSTETLQTCSQPIVCTQPPGIPEICKKSLTVSPTTGNIELFVLGKNFLKDTRVIFQQVRGDQSGSEREVVWEEIVTPDKEFLQQTHLVCVVPPYARHDIVEPVPINLLVVSSGKTSEPHPFMYTPSPPSTSTTASYMAGRGPSLGLWSSEIIPKAETDVGMMPPPAPFANFTSLPRRPSGPEQSLKTELLDDNSRSSDACRYADASDSNMTSTSDNSVDGSSTMVVRHANEISMDMHSIHAGDNSVDINIMRSTENSVDMNIIRVNDNRGDVSMMRTEENSVDLNMIRNSDNSVDVAMIRTAGDSNVALNMMRVNDNSVDMNIMHGSDNSVDVSMMRVSANNVATSITHVNDNSVDINMIRPSDNVDINIINSTENNITMNMIRNNDNINVNMMRTNDNNLNICNLMRTADTNMSNIIRTNNSNVVVNMMPLGMTTVDGNGQACKDIARPETLLIVDEHRNDVTAFRAIGGLSNGSMETLSNTNAFTTSTDTSSLTAEDLKGIDLRTKAPIATVSDLIDTRPPSMATLRQFGVTEASTAPMPAQSAQSVENYLTTIENDKLISTADKKILPTVFEHTGRNVQALPEILSSNPNHKSIQIESRNDKAIFDEPRGLITNRASGLLDNINSSNSNLHSTEPRHEIVIPSIDTRPIMIFSSSTNGSVIMDNTQSVPPATMESHIASVIENSLLTPTSATEKLDDFVNSAADTHMGSPPIVSSETSPASSLSNRLSPDHSPTSGRSSLSPHNCTIGPRSISSDVMISTHAPVMQALPLNVSSIKVIDNIEVGGDALSPEIILDPQVSPSLMCRSNVPDNMLLSPRANVVLTDICQTTTLANDSTLDVATDNLSHNSNREQISSPIKKISPTSVKTMYLENSVDILQSRKRIDTQQTFQSLLGEHQNVENSIMPTNQQISTGNIGLYTTNGAVVTSQTFTSIPSAISNLHSNVPTSNYLNSSEFVQERPESSAAEIEPALSNAPITEIVTATGTTSVPKENVLARELTISETDLINYINPSCFEQSVYPA